LLGSVLGLGGGIIIIPFLTLVWGVHIRYAMGASLIAVIATSSGAAAAYVKDNLTNIRLAILLEVATTLGALGGVLWVPKLPIRVLYLLFSIVAVYGAFMMMRKRESYGILKSGDRWAKKLRLDSSYPDRALRRNVEYGVQHVGLGFVLMGFAGVISGILGIGSGVLKVPAMDLAMKLPIKVSSATSSFMIGVTAVASAIVYFVRGDIVPLLAVPVALGVVIGSLVGTRVMTRLPAQAIRILFVVLLTVIAVQMMLKAWSSPL
jgi:uncharacterized membrane protein YfcA